MALSRSPASAEAGTTTAADGDTPRRKFLRTETGSSALLLAATVAALIWANVSTANYDSVWATQASVTIGHTGVAQDLRGWVNSGLMTFFFLVVGLEARREFDMGELRRRSQLALPLAAGVAGAVLPVAIFLAINAGHPSSHGWGAAMSTDTAFALGVLALVGRGLPLRVRTYLLTVSVVDDLVGILVIAFFYSEHIRVAALLVGLALLGVVLVLRQRRVRYGPPYFVIGLAAWVAFFKSGVDPVSVGLAIGLLTFAYPAARDDLQQASELFRSFREQPTAELAQSARLGVSAAISPNERLQSWYHPWTSYAIVPLFALANVGIPIDAGFLAHAYTSRITLGILIAYVVGKPVGTVGAAWVLTRVSRGRVRLPVGWAGAAGAGAAAGIGFTVSLLIATLAFHGVQLEQAKLGVLSAALVASAGAWAVFRITALLPKPLRQRALLGTSESIIDLAVPVDKHRDHIRGPADSLVTIVEYGDFECPYCGQAEPVVRELLAAFGDVRYVWRHLPLSDVHPRAEIAAEASEAAAKQGAFWPMHDLLLDRQDALTPVDLRRYASELGLDVERFASELRQHVFAARIAEDADSADLSGVSGTPSFFINGRRHHGAYDIETLTTAVRAAYARAQIARA
ncbi:Na+/H+ antiporter NhaA [Catenulispora sp. NF23]|uniref:Na+/H+ antiporter NhaA n=1 Tax=Catenulispora pinistramenti TaxID=2705254 RepID=UPI001BA65029|nr:Na+/H+ antiporter NhaA [Catenulispora pinistramenti]MBS2532161.1 Na+/H+ antiporter NhaA [Catenulispora pinistramenti]